MAGPHPTPFRYDVFLSHSSADKPVVRELAERRGLVVLQPDFHGLFLEIQAQPEAWGFRELSRPVLGAGGEDGSPPGAERVREVNGRLVAPDAQGFLWWDAWGHLTSAFHRVLAGRVLSLLKGYTTGGEP